MNNVGQTIISQYGGTRTLSQIITDLNDYIDPAVNIDDFYNFCFNVSTAQGFGLDIWGRIVQVDRQFSVPADTPNPGGYPFTPGVVILTDAQYRQAILVKALANITGGNAPSLNALLTALFETRGRTYCLDVGGMVMRFVFEFYLQPWEYQLLSNSAAAPRNAGVLIDVRQIDLATTFGFYEALQFQPFDQAPFYNAS